VRSGRMEPADDVGNGRANARDVAKREQAFRRAAIGTSPVRIAPAQRAALAELSQQFGYGRSVEIWHRDTHGCGTGTCMVVNALDGPMRAMGRGRKGLLWPTDWAGRAGEPVRDSARPWR
jgi:hypothetical protein